MPQTVFSIFTDLFELISLSWLLSPHFGCCTLQRFQNLEPNHLFNPWGRWFCHYPYLNVNNLPPLKFIISKIQRKIVSYFMLFLNYIYEDIYIRSKSIILISVIAYWKIKYHNFCIYCAHSNELLFKKKNLNYDKWFYLSSFLIFLLLPHRLM